MSRTTPRRDPDDSERRHARQLLQALGARHQRADRGDRRDHHLPDDGLHHLRQPADPRDHRHGPQRGLRRDLPRGGARLLHHGASTPTGRSRWRRAWGSTPSSPSPWSARMGFTWQQALGAVFISGCIFLILTVTGVRRWLIAGHPALDAERGRGRHRHVPRHHRAEERRHRRGERGDLRHARPHDRAPAPLLAMLGFFLIAALDALKVKGAILIGILAVTVISIAARRAAVRRHHLAAAVDRADLPPARHLRRARDRHPPRRSWSSCWSRCSTPPAR